MYDEKEKAQNESREKIMKMQRALQEKAASEAKAAVAIEE
jgi:hypothetical protein